MNTDRVALHVWIGGRVQGVAFRDSTRRTAVTLGLTGWVRNLPDGRVEAVFVGTRAACEAALAFAHQGPAHARVDRVEVRWEEAPAGAGTRFEIR